MTVADLPFQKDHIRDNVSRRELERVSYWLEIETKAYFTLHKRYPHGREAEDVVENACMSIRRERIPVSYESVAQLYSDHMDAMIRRLENSEHGT